MDPRWLQSASRDAKHGAHHSLLIGCEDGVPVSVVSVGHTADGTRAACSMLVAPERRRQGAGRATVQALRAEFPNVEEFVAYVDPDNQDSIKLLRALGFTRTEYAYPDRDLYAWRRDGVLPAADWKPPAIPRSY
jgi:ribosomal protein S18 acetylase RimI-like enzyme